MKVLVDPERIRSRWMTDMIVSADDGRELVYGAGNGGGGVLTSVRSVKGLRSCSDLSLGLRSLLTDDCACISGIYHEAEDSWLLIAHRTSSSLPVFLDDLSANNHVFRYSLGVLLPCPGHFDVESRGRGWDWSGCGCDCGLTLLRC